jgi:hypothetical protein
MKKIKKMLACLLVGGMMLSLTACGSNSEVNNSYNDSAYKKVTIYNGYNTSIEDMETFDKYNGHLTMETSDGGATVHFYGFYEMKCIYVNSSNPNGAFRTNSVQEFAKTVGFKDYDKLASDETYVVEGNVLFDYRGYVAYFVPNEDGTGTIHVGKVFNYEPTNKEDLLSVFALVNEYVNYEANYLYDKEMHLDENGKYTPEEFQFCTFLGYDRYEVDETGNETPKQYYAMLDSTMVSYTIHTIMRDYLFELSNEIKIYDDKIKKELTSDIGF